MLLGPLNNNLFPTIRSSPLCRLTEQLPASLIRIDAVDCRFRNTFRIVSAEGDNVTCKTKPSANVLLMRSEHEAFENEIAARQLLRTISTPTADIIYHDKGRNLLQQPLFIVRPCSGSLLADCDLSVKEEEAIVSQVNAIQHEINHLRAYQFGATGLVAQGKGYAYWHDAFQDMVEDLLQDGEDVLLNLPYISIREVMACSSALLVEPKESSLMIRNLSNKHNLIVNDVDGVMKVVDMENLWDVLWVDPQFDPMRQRDEAGNALQLLYSMHHAIHDIVEGFYHPGLEKDDSKSRRELAGCLMELSKHIRCK